MGFTEGWSKRPRQESDKSWGQRAAPGAWGLNAPSFHSASPPSHTLKHLPHAIPSQTLGREESDLPQPWRGSQSVPREWNKGSKKKCHLRPDGRCGS